MCVRAVRACVRVGAYSYPEVGSYVEALLLLLQFSTCTLIT